VAVTTVTTVFGPHTGGFKLSCEAVFCLIAPAHWSWSFALRHEAMRLKGQWDTDLLDWVDDKQLWHPDTDSDTDSGDDDEPLVRARHLKRRFR
jgi:hypothetical protein